MIPTYIILLVSAYCPCEICCGDSADGKTATGRSAYTKGVATDWAVIARGSRIDIPGYKNWALVDDTGGALRAATKRGKIQIDVRFQSHKRALRWGVKTLKCRVWRKKREEKELTGGFIKACVAPWLRYNRQCLMVCFERDLGYFVSGQPDILAISKEHFVIEVEVKVSVSDFRKDKKKRKWEMEGGGFLRNVRQFYYAVPKNMVEKIKDDIPRSCGLMAIDDFYHHRLNDNVAIIKKAPTNRAAERVTLPTAIRMAKAQTGTLCYLAKKVWGLEKKCSG